MVAKRFFLLYIDVCFVSTTKMQLQTKFYSQSLYSFNSPNQRLLQTLSNLKITPISVVYFIFNVESENCGFGLVDRKIYVICIRKKVIRTVQNNDLWTMWVGVTKFHCLKSSILFVSLY